MCYEDGLRDQQSGLRIIHQRLGGELRKKVMQREGSGIENQEVGATGIEKNLWLPKGKEGADR